MSDNLLILPIQETHYECAYSRSVSRLTLNIRAGMCRYWSAEGGPCTMCPLPIYQRDILGGIRPAWDELRPALLDAWGQAAGESPLVVRIFHGGNFVIEDEVSVESQVEIIRFLSSRPSVDRIVIESKPEYLTEDRIERILNARVRPVDIQVNMGYETYSERVRLDSLNKGCTNEDFRRAFRLLRSKGMHPFVYLIIQPPGIAPNQSVQEVTEGVRWITQLTERTEIALLALYIEKQTIAHKSWKLGVLAPPTLHLVAEAILAARKAHPLGWISFGGVRDNDELTPVAYARGCHKCESVLEKALSEYKKSADIGVLESALRSVTPCDCA